MCVGGGVQREIGARAKAQYRGSLYGEIQGIMGNGHMGPSPVDKMTATTKNIISQQICSRLVMKTSLPGTMLNSSCSLVEICNDRVFRHFQHLLMALIVCACFIVKYVTSVTFTLADQGFPRRSGGGAGNYGVKSRSIIWQYFSREWHENERN